MARIPLYYTFGNHMHWVDMEWLWGYHVLPGSIRDMLRFCRETGARGNVNFEGIGYEKLAAEDPEALAELRQAVQEGIIEPVGCSYGQPYGLFHGGESNLRQRIYGARTARRLLGVWPKTFWEEEFDFFPQLPQMLKGCGFEYASLFFQWTWHTPEIPKEEAPVVLWEGQDGSQLLCATRNKLNLHQWPEDMDATFAELAASPPVAGEGPIPLILQWLELMPSPDWMCRSELLLPKMRELLSDERFEIRMATLGEYLRGVEGAPVRKYSMDHVWHGMSLGKNADNIRRLSREAESTLLSAETLAAINGLLGRPYSQWDVYPTWELEEAWRELLSAQHHDNDECEGLCGNVGRYSYERSLSLSRHVGRSNLLNLGQRIGGADCALHLASFFVTPGSSKGSYGEDHFFAGVEPGEARFELLYNPLGWHRRAVSTFGGNIVELPAFGFAVASREAARIELARQVEVEVTDGQVQQFRNAVFPEGVLSGPPTLSLIRDGKATAVGDDDSDETTDRVSVACWHNPFGDVEMRIQGNIARPDGGLNSSLQLTIPISFEPRLWTDQPYGISQVSAARKDLKKYPTGDWMTSPQWFEDIEGAFSSLTLVDLVDSTNPERGVLILHDGSQQWFWDPESRAVRCILSAYDPWDEAYFETRVDTRLRVFLHGSMTHSQRWRAAQEFLKPPQSAFFNERSEAPVTLSALSCDAPNVVPTAFYRETEDYSGKHVDNYAGKGMGYPFVVRLVEFDGIETEATLTVAGTVAAVYKTNHLGQILETLHPLTPSSKTNHLEEEGQRTQISISLRPYEIATLYLDIVEGRKETRDLDAKRKIWATVHRVDD